MILEQIRDMLAKQLNIDKQKITPDTDIIADLNADSLDIVEMIMGIEEEFGIEIKDEDAQGMRRISDIVAFVEKNKK